MASKTTAEVSPSNGSVAGGHLVEHRAEREEVGARVGQLAARLLGRHVGDRADVEPAAVSSFGCTAVGAVGARLRRRPGAPARSSPGRSRGSSPGRASSRRCSPASGRGGRCPSRAPTRARPRSGSRGRAAARSRTARRRIRSASVSPSSSSIAMKCWPSCCSIAWTVQMPGWLSAEAARASRWKRSSVAASCASSAGRNFSATCRPSLVSSASYTTPMPPLPSFAVIR